jgi:MFS family permease
MEKTNSSKNPKFFYGYWIVAVAFCCCFIFSGCGFYAFSLFVKPLQDAFGWGRGQIMLGWTVSMLTMGLSAPFIGRVIDRYGPRRVITVGAFMGGLGFILLSQMQQLWHLYASYVLIGLGNAAMGATAATAVVSNWFKKRRGTAIGIMATGIGAGGFVLAPLIGGYLIPNFGWRGAYLTLVALFWALIPLALIVIRTKPSDKGLYPDGMEASEAEAEAEASPSALSGLSLKAAVSTSTFWLIFVSFVAQGFHVGVIQNTVPHLGDIGFPVVAAATALGTVGLGSLIGKFFFGWLCDRIPAKFVWCIGLSLQFIAIIIITTMVGPTSPMALIWLYAILIGLGIGSWLPSMSMLVSTNFGLASYGAIFGLTTLAQSIGGSVSPPLAGYMYDAMGTYHWAFILFMCLNGVGIPAALLIRRPKALLAEKQK